MRKLVKSSAQLSVASVFQILTGIVRNKALAVFVGPFGVGIIGQMQALIATLGPLSNIGMKNAVLKYTAQYSSQRDKDHYDKTICTAFGIVTILSGVMLSLAVAFSTQASNVFFKTEHFGIYVIIAAAYVFISSLSAIVGSVLRGNLRIKESALAVILSSSILMFLMLVLIPLLGLSGAITLLFISPFITLYFNSFYANRRTLLPAKIWNFDIKTMRQLMTFGLVILIAGFGINASWLFTKTFVVRNLGLAKVGMYQAAWALTSSYMLIPLKSVSGYAFPKIATLQSNEDICVQVNNLLRLCIFVITPVVVGVMIFADLLILLFYSSEFLPAADILRIQLIGNLFRVIYWNLNVTLLPTGRLISHLAFELGWAIMFVLAVILLVPHLGLRGVAVAFVMTYTFVALFVYIYERIILKFRFTAENRILLISAFVVIILSFLFTRSTNLKPYSLVMLPLLVPWFLLSSTRDERRKLVPFAIEWITGKKKMNSLPHQ